MANGEEDAVALDDCESSEDMAGTLGINLEPGWRSLWVDLASLMNPTPYTAQACVPGPISRA